MSDEEIVRKWRSRPDEKFVNGPGGDCAIVPLLVLAALLRVLDGREQQLSGQLAEIDRLRHLIDPEEFPPSAPEVTK